MRWIAIRRRSSLEALALARASLKNAWRALLRGIGRSLPIGLLVPFSIAAFVLGAFVIHRLIRGYLGAIHDPDLNGIFTPLVLYFGAFAFISAGLTSASGANSSLPPLALALAPLSRAAMLLAWSAPVLLCELGLALYLSVPITLAVGDFLSLERLVIARLVLYMSVVLWSGAQIGTAVWSLLHELTRRSILSSLRFLPAVAATLGVMVLGGLFASSGRFAALRPWIRSIERELLASASVPNSMANGLLIMAVFLVGLLGVYVRLMVAGNRDFVHKEPPHRALGAGPTSIAKLDLCLWCRERQGFALAVASHAFWLVLCVYLVDETMSISRGLPVRPELGKLQEVLGSYMPIAWGFTSSLSVGLTYDGGRQVMMAPLNVSEIVWSKFAAALSFGALQWLLCGIGTGLVLGNLKLPRGLSTIAALFVLASACAFVAGVLLPVGKRRIRAGFGTALTSILALILFLLCLSLVLGLSYVFLSGDRERSLAQVILCFALVSLLISAASKGARVYGLAR